MANPKASKAERNTARRNLENAKDALDTYGRNAYAAGIREETEEFNDLNQAVIAAEDTAKAVGVSWWHRQ